MPYLGRFEHRGAPQKIITDLYFNQLYIDNSIVIELEVVLLATELGNSFQWNILFEFPTNSGNIVVLKPHGSDTWGQTSGKIRYKISQLSGEIKTSFRIFSNSGADFNSQINITIPVQPIPVSKPTLSKNRCNVGDIITINTNRISTALTHKAVLIFGKINQELASDITDSFILNTTDYDLYSEMKNTASKVGTIKLRTYLGTTHIGDSSVDFTINVINSNPIFNDFNFEDSNEITKALTGNNQNFIIGYSNAKATIDVLNKATAQNQASMSKYRIVIGNQQQEVTYSDEEDIISTINGVENTIVVVSAIDSRGLQTSISKTAGLINYNNLLINKFELEREDGIGKKVFFNIEGTFWNDNFGVVQNNIKAIKFRYKQRTDEDFSEWIRIDSKFNIEGNTFKNKIDKTNFFPTTDNSATILYFDNIEYDIEINITDELYTNTVSFKLNSGIPCTAKRKNSNQSYSIGINKIPDDDENVALDVKGNIGSDNIKILEDKVNTINTDTIIYKDVFTSKIEITLIFKKQLNIVTVQTTVALPANSSSLLLMPEGLTIPEKYIDKLDDIYIINNSNATLWIIKESAKVMGIGNNNTTDSVKTKAVVSYIKTD